MKKLTPTQVAKLDSVNSPTTLLSISLQDTSDGGRKTHISGNLTANVGILISPPLSERELQDVAYAAKMKAIQLVHARKRGRAALKGAT